MNNDEKTSKNNGVSLTDYIDNTNYNDYSKYYDWTAIKTNNNNFTWTSSDLSSSIYDRELNIRGEYMNFIAEILGLPSLEEFSNMTVEERKKSIRDIKIDNLLK